MFGAWVVGVKTDHKLIAAEITVDSRHCSFPPDRMNVGPMMNAKRKRNIDDVENVGAQPKKRKLKMLAPLGNGIKWDLTILSTPNGSLNYQEKVSRYIKETIDMDRTIDNGQAPSELWRQKQPLTPNRRRAKDEFACPQAVDEDSIPPASSISGNDGEAVAKRCGTKAHRQRLQRIFRSIDQRQCAEQIVDGVQIRKTIST